MMTDRELLPLWQNLHHVYSTIRAALSSRLDDAEGCSLLEHDLMSWLEVEGGRRPRMHELATLIGMTPSGTTRLVDRLVQRGWLRREQPANNRREIHTRLTTAGRQVLGRARTAYFEVLRETIGTHLDDTAVTDLTALTDTLLRNLNAPPAHSRPTG